MSDMDFPTYSELTQTDGWGTLTSSPVSTGDFTVTDQRYTESAILGVGGMGKVLLAKDARIGREVAVKVLHPERELSEEQQARFVREAQVQGQLEHPSIVPVYDIDRRPDGSAFFTMRRVFGTTLQKIIDDLRDGTEPKLHTQRELLQAFATVCLAVDYAHSRGVIHRDLKPSNIMLGDFGEVYVLDWGVARVLDSSATDVDSSRISRRGMTLGTPLYMAPEQAKDPEVGVTADVFALGAILFEILTLERLRFPRMIDAPIDARISTRMPALSIAPELEAICVKATQADPADRFATARELQAAVARYMDGDRELEQRRELAHEHVRRARVALESQNDDAATLELARALALDPTNIEHVSMMAEVLGTPPKTIPEDVKKRIDAIDVAIMRTGSRHAAIAALSWLLFFPLLFVLGLRRVDYVFVIIVPILATSAIAWWLRHRPTVIWLQVVTISINAIGCMALSRLFGPSMIMPSLLATWAIVLQAHPYRVMRVFGLATSAFCIVAPVVLEQLGVLPASYNFDGGFAVIPQMVEFPETATLAFLTLASVAITLVPAMSVGRLRDALEASQQRELMQTWRLRRLGDSMLRV
jgi:eukaryotic-like serine/threonine-protein kinase